VRRAVSPVKRPRGDDPDRDVGHTQQQQQQQVRVCTTTTMEALCNRLPRTDNVRPSGAPPSPPRPLVLLFKKRPPRGRLQITRGKLLRFEARRSRGRATTPAVANIGLARSAPPHAFVCAVQRRRLAGRGAKSRCAAATQHMARANGGPVVTVSPGSPPTETTVVYY